MFYDIFSLKINVNGMPDLKFKKRNKLYYKMF